MAEGGYDEFHPFIQNREEEEHDQDDAYEENIPMQDIYAEVESSAGDLKGLFTQESRGNGKR